MGPMPKPMALALRTSTPSEVRIYHICSLATLRLIVGSGDLCPLNVLRERHCAPPSIAYSHL